MIGIYKITSPSGKVYIGQSWDINKRKNIYSKGAHKSQRLLKRSIDKYGWHLHCFEVLHIISETSSQLHLDYLECFFWRLEILKGSQMLNIREPGSRGKLSDETKGILSKQRLGNNNPMFGVKMSETNKTILRERWTGKNNPSYGKDLSGPNNPTFGRKRSEQERLNQSLLMSKPIIQLDKNYKVINEWQSAKHAERATGIAQTNISLVCREKRKSAGGFLWKFKN